MSRKYYQIRSSAVQRSDFQVNKVRTFSQNKDLLTRLFNKYDIPEKYQKIYLSKKAFNKFEDFFTGVSFEVKITPDKRISVFFEKKSEQPDINFHVYAIYGYEAKCTTKEVISFYKKLYDEKLLKKYLMALNEFFVLDMQLGYLLELNDSKKSAWRQQRLYRKRIK